MEIRRFVVNSIQANCYVLSESMDKGARAVVVDPGDTALDEIFSYIDAHGFQVIANWNTHAHYDHVVGVDLLRNRYHCPAYLHPEDQPVWDEVPNSYHAWTGQETGPLNPPDIPYREGDVVQLGEEAFRIWHTPGHSPGGVCLVGKDVAFTGDTIFKSTIGRTDLAHGDAAAMEQSLVRILDWPDELVLYPGHGDCSTLAREREHNRFLRIVARGGV
ncbi:MBL fold metallo-hydrolase [Alicyclobacillus fodiniaquatilis]|uniref:MBL fold metallo-hydrolase n=1 Tax=Alicyclobacillus fodiniaquatilis TaxID=1661150 RepID=A0ABW4JKN9_9BACL